MNSENTPTQAMNAVMNKDRAAWLGCFAPDAILRDPVGGSPFDPSGEGLVGREALGRFWDAAIAPTGSVQLTVRNEYVSGASIARLAEVAIDMGEGRALKYEGIFIYDLDASGLIRHLHGYFPSPFA